MRTHHTASLLLIVALTVFAATAEDKPKPAEPGILIIIDAAGKEQKLKTWKFTEGVRRLGWLAPAKNTDSGGDAGADRKAAPKGKRQPTAGPEALALCAEMEIEYAEGVLTLVPLTHVGSIDFDNEKDTMTVQVGEGEAAEKIAGSTKYKRINKLVIEAEVDKGDLGIAEVKYLGGVPRGIRSVRFPAPKAAPPVPQGRRVLVVSDDGKNKTSQHKVVDLLPLYRLPDGVEKLLPTIMFRKTLKLDVGKIKKIAAVRGGESGWQVALKDGGEETLTLRETIPYEGKEARLLGFVGRIPAGYKLFPPSAIAEITFDAEKK
jgi:hypothetical protein